MARFPVVGGDEGNWGQILNDFLKETHNDDGSLKPISQSKIQSLTADLAAKANIADLGTAANTNTTDFAMRSQVLSFQASLTVAARVKIKSAVCIADFFIAALRRATTG